MLQEEVNESEFLPGKKKGLKLDGGIDPETLAPDLLAACKENNDAGAQDFLADGVPPGYSDPESGALYSCFDSIRVSRHDGRYGTTLRCLLDIGIIPDC